MTDVKFFKALNILINEGYQQLYIKSWYSLTVDDIHDPSRWDSVAIYSGTEKLAWMIEHHDNWEISGYRPYPHPITLNNIPPGAIELDEYNRLLLGVAFW